MPGLNDFDKKACLFAGVFPHRKNLNEMILLKSNHLIFFDKIEDAFDLAKNASKKTKAKLFEIEVKNLEDALKIASLKADWIMLDNFSLEDAKEAIRKIREISPKTIIECSGGINLNNLKDYVYLGPDIISMGCLTKDARMIDFSLRVKKL
jgi:nicotinate-nucleotide pyrophosphorylase (carboxylating)